MFGRKLLSSYKTWQHGLTLQSCIQANHKTSGIMFFGQTTPNVRCLAVLCSITRLISQPQPQDLSFIENCFLFPKITDMLWPHLVAMNHDVVCGDQGFKNHHPAGVAGSLHQHVGHLGDVHVGFLGGLNQDCEAQRKRRAGAYMMDVSRRDIHHRYIQHVQV